MAQTHFAPTTCTYNCARPVKRTGVLAWLMLLDARYKQREALRHMSYRQLEDVGITPAEAQAEANQPIWRASPLPFLRG